MTLLNKLLTIIFIGTLFVACNPDCETYTNIASDVSPPFRPPGSDIMITTNPVDFLANRDVFIQKQNLGETEITKMESIWYNGLGRTATLPMDVDDTQTIYIEDGDCGGFIPLNNINVRSNAWFASNLDYITPPPPTIVIPQIPVTPPVNVVNAWFSPNDRQYCIWFAPDLDNDGNEISTLIPGDVTALPPDPDVNRSSLELAFGCNGGVPVDDLLYHINPVSGIVDKELNVIQISIDRTAKGLGIEEFEGEFINGEDLLSEYSISGPCGTQEVQKTEFMILRSKTTGQQLLLFQN